jgi:hypothetical protein
MSEQQSCRFDFTDKNQTVVGCTLHPKERRVLTPQTRHEVLAQLVKDGQWAGPALPLSAAGPAPASLPAVPDSRLPATAPTPTYDLVAYQTPDGQTVSLSVALFRQMLCPEANDAQARYMLGWCQHNRIDPFSNEAYFSIMSNKPVIQVSKDAWFRRMERHPAFVSHDSGIIVETSLQAIKEAIISGFDHYLVSDALRQKIVADFTAGRVSDPKGIPERLIVRKRGMFLGEKDTLLGGWAEIRRNDRPHPYLFQIDKKGWETRKKEGGDNNFWIEKAPFMIWKTALKNCARLAFPELSGLFGQPELPEDFDPATAADYELTTHNTNADKRRLFVLGRDVPPPVGPLAYPQLHALAGGLYDGKGISELTGAEMARFLARVELAAGGDPQTLSELQGLLDHTACKEPMPPLHAPTETAA